MAWDFSTEPEFQRKLDWVKQFCEDKVEPLDQTDDELDTSLDLLSRLAAAAESPGTIKECFGLYPEFQPPADAVAR